MKKSFSNRIKALEDKAIYQRGPIPALVCFYDGLPGSKTFEEAKAEYKQIHGFELPKNAPVLHIYLDE